VIVSEYIKQVTSTFSPPPSITVSQWADKYRVLSPESSAEPGQWMTERAEYQRGIMDVFNDPSVEDIVVVSSSQVGKTEILGNVIGYYIEQDPSPLMVVQPTLEMAQTWSKERLSPMLRDTPVLNGKVRNVKSRDSENTILSKVFPNGNLTISGANSPASLAGRPKRVAIGDDVDRFPPSAGTEGDPVKLLFKRTTAFWNRKRALFSTPTNQNSRIWKAFQFTDQRYYFVPCPKCGEFQTLKWKDKVTGKYRVKWEKDKRGKPLPHTAYYECEHCEAHLTDADIIWMVRRGEWRATQPFNGKAGFSLNEIYSPWVKLRETVDNFLESEKDPELLKVWINTALGEIFEERGDAPEWERIYMRREKYPIGKIPAGGLLLVAGADVQKDRVEVEILAYGRGRQTWSIDYRVIMEDMTTPGAKAALDKLMQEQFPHELGGRAMIRVLAIDSGYATQDVYNWARRYPPNRVMAVKGSSTSSMILGLPKLVDVTVDGRKIERGARYWPVGVSVCKTELYGLLRLEKNPDGTFPDGYCHFPEYDEEFFKGMTAEELVMVGRRPEWKKTRERNEQLDCRNYGRAAASFCGIDRFIEETWKALENEMRAVPVQQAVPRHKVKKRSGVLSKGIQI
jgi:phage terminase large subunit GpA-like protein